MQNLRVTRNWNMLPKQCNQVAPFGRWTQLALPLCCGRWALKRAIIEDVA